MALKTLYIAGPYTAPDLDGVRRNIEAARKLGREVAKLGAMPFIPHTNTDETFAGIQDAQFWYDGTMRMLEVADGVLMMEAWVESKGARAERRRADQLAKPMFFEQDPDWKRNLSVWARV